MKVSEQIHQFIEKQKMAYIGSIDSEGFPNVKAILSPRRVEDNCYYFPARMSSLRVNQYKDNNKACVYFCSKGFFHFDGLMLIGTMEIMEDPATKRAMWKPGDDVYFKEGVSDPDYCVLRFVASKARCLGDNVPETIDFECKEEK